MIFWRRKDESSAVISAFAVRRVVDEVSGWPSEKLRMNGERLLSEQPALRRFVMDQYEGWPSSVQLRATATLVSIIRMFEEELGPQPGEIGRDLIQHCAAANRLLLERLQSGGRRPAISAMDQPAVFEFVSSVLDSLRSEPANSGALSHVFDLFFLLKTLVDVMALSYEQGIPAPTVALKA